MLVLLLLDYWDPYIDWQSHTHTCYPSETLTYYSICFLLLHLWTLVSYLEASMQTLLPYTCTSIYKVGKDDFENIRAISRPPGHRLESLKFMHYRISGNFCNDLIFCFFRDLFQIAKYWIRRNYILYHFLRHF